MFTIGLACRADPANEGDAAAVPAIHHDRPHATKAVETAAALAESDPLDTDSHKFDATIDPDAHAELGEARAYQEQLARQYAEDPQSPFAAVASHYLAQGSEVTLRGDRSPPHFLLGSPGDALDRVMHFAYTDALRCLVGCTINAVLEGRQTLSLDRLTVLVSPQSGAARLLVYDPQAPGRRTFTGLHWFPVDERFIVDARFEPRSKPESLELTTSRGLKKTAHVVGSFVFTLAGATSEHRLTAMTFEDPAAAMLSMFIPFSDGTSNDSTYGAGRYLEFDMDASATRVRLDFNRAHNPLCAYSRHFNCPLPPKANRLKVAIEAGERTYLAH